MAVRLLLLCVILMAMFAQAAVCSCAQSHMPPSGWMGVPSLWYCYFWGCGLKSLGTSCIRAPSDFCLMIKCALFVLV